MDLKSVEFYMREALLEAEAAYEKGEMPVGAVVVMDGDIIARAHNLTEKNADPTAHAELLSIVQAAHKKGAWRLTGATIFSTLEPCPMCAGAIINARLDSVYYGAYDKKYGCCGSVYRITEDPAFTHFTPATGGILQPECAAIITRHFQRCRGKGRLP